jgi:hypothetical protein
MDDSAKPDSFEKRLRFGCGFVFGAGVAFFVALQALAAFTGTFWAVVAGVAVVSGLVAMRYGDHFWHAISAISDWFRWW